MKRLRESALERRFVKEIRAIGGLCLKFCSPSMAGVPDRIVLLAGMVFFVELKAPGGRLSPRQVAAHKIFLQNNLHITVIDSPESLSLFLDFLKMLL